MTDLDTRARVHVLEASYSKLEVEVKEGFAGLTKSIDRISQNLHSRPVTPPFKEIMATIGATLTVVVIVASIIGSYVDRSIALAAADVRSDKKVIEYRLEQLEKRPPVVAMPFSSGLATQR